MPVASKPELDLQLDTLEPPRLCETIAPTVCDHVGMRHEKTLSRPLHHRVDGARGRNLVRKLLSDVRRYAQPVIGAGEAPGNTPGPVVLGACAEGKVGA